MAYKKEYKKKDEVIKKEWKLKHPLTDEQDAIANSSDQSVMGEAVAGSGKSTMILERAKREATKNGKSAFLTLFSKSLADELEVYSNEFLSIGTKHRMGLKLFYMNGKKPFIDANKSRNLLIKQLKFDPSEMEDGEQFNGWKQLYAMVDLADKLRVRMADWTDINQVSGINNQYDCEVADLDLVQKLMKLSLEKSETGWIDFTDMNYGPLLMNFNFKKYDAGYMDECQDFSPMDAMFLERCISDGGKMTFVGDSRQSIMGFTGADTSMMEKLKNKFNCSVYPISYTFRCPRAVVDAVIDKGYHDTIKAWHGAKDGAFNPDSEYNIHGYENGTMLLARRNASLIAPALKAYKSGRSVSVIGELIESKMFSILRHLKCNTICEMRSQVMNQHASKIEKLIGSKKARASTIDLVNDTYETLITIINECTLVDQVEKTIKEIFKPKKDSLLYSSMHRSKGREAERVVILDSSKMTLEMSNLDEDEIQQEKNLCYVAMTRAKSQLEFVK